MTASTGTVPPLRDVVWTPRDAEEAKVGGMEGMAYLCLTDGTLRIVTDADMWPYRGRRRWHHIGKKENVNVYMTPRPMTPLQFEALKAFCSGCPTPPVAPPVPPAMAQFYTQQQWKELLICHGFYEYPQ